MLMSNLEESDSLSASFQQYNAKLWKEVSYPKSQVYKLTVLVASLVERIPGPEMEKEFDETTEGYGASDNIATEL